MAESAVRAVSLQRSDGNNKLQKQIDTNVKAVTRAVLPAWKTTPIPILHRESDIPLLLDQVRLRQATRVADRDPRHLIV